MLLTLSNGMQLFPRELPACRGESVRKIRHFSLISDWNHEEGSPPNWFHLRGANAMKIKYETSTIIGF